MEGRLLLFSSWFLGLVLCTWSQKRRDAEEARLRQDFESRMALFEKWADKLEAKTRGRFFPSEDGQ